MPQANSVQIFGTKNSQATRAAERYFKERQVAIHFVDLQQRPMARGEINRFIERFKLPGLIDTESKTYKNSGLAYLRLSDADWLSRIEREPALLRLPLVRGRANKLSVGHDEASWQAMV